MAFRTAGQLCAAQRDPLVYRAIVADFGGLADYHPHPMINEYAFADPGSGMNFDPGQHTPDVGNQPSCQEPAALPEPVSQTVVKKGLKSGIAENNLKARPGGGVASQRRVDFLPQVFQKHRNPYVC
jgi:hypothetical protein